MVAPVVAGLAAAAIIVVSLALIALGWYQMGWVSFPQYKTGDSPSWAAKSGDLSRLRFKNCTFTVTRPDGVVKSKDVAVVLTAMAIAYGGVPQQPPALTLTGLLNPFSFVIDGFNDRATVSDPTTALWKGSTATLSGSWREL